MCICNKSMSKLKLHHKKFKLIYSIKQFQSYNGMRLCQLEKKLKKTKKQKNKRRERKERKKRVMF